MRPGATRSRPLALLLRLAVVDLAHDLPLAVHLEQREVVREPDLRVVELDLREGRVVHHVDAHDPALAQRLVLRRLPGGAGRELLAGARDELAVADALDLRVRVEGATVVVAVARRVALQVQLEWHARARVRGVLGPGGAGRPQHQRQRGRASGLRHLDNLRSPGPRYGDDPAVPRKTM